MMLDFRPFEVAPESTVKTKLAAVLVYFESLIKEIIQEEPDSRSFENEAPGRYFWSKVIDKDVVTSMRRAWPDIEMRIHKARSSISELNDQAAFDHGLSGSELDLKLEALAWASRELVRATKKIPDAVTPRKEKRIISVLKKTLEVIDIPIESILEATGAKTALKEILGVFTHGFKDYLKR